MTLIFCPRAAPRRAYKGAWRGLHVGTGADTTWSPRLSPLRVLQGNLPWAISEPAMGHLQTRHGPVVNNPPWACLRIRHKCLRPVPPWQLQQLGRPVWRIRHTTLDGPPWLADLGLRRWYTYLVYPQQ
jgi:hypothetical protein